MDIYCVRCGEPWELDLFHDVAAEQDSTWEAAVADFRRRGCVATGWTGQCVKRDTGIRGEVMGMLLDLGDIDGAAAEMEDFDAAGLFDSDGTWSEDDQGNWHRIGGQR